MNPFQTISAMTSYHRLILSFAAVALLPLCPAGAADAFSIPDLKPRQGLPPFEYTDAPAELPNYTPGARWGTQGEAIRTMQKPLSPEASAQHLVTTPEFDIHLFAAEPDIIKPLWLSWDERGRLWIAESIDYPNEMQPEGQGRDRLKICEDTDGDGRADKFTVFADQLSVPTSFVFANGGVIVIHSGQTEFLKDTDGDDQADERRVLFTGWGTRDTHAAASNLRYGFDNWIWGTVGYSGFRGEVGGKEIRFGQGIFRFKPDGSALEFVRSSNNNTWGLAFTEDNLVIGSTANGNASMYMPIPNRYYEAVNGWSASRLESITTNQHIYPITEKVRQVDWHGLYTAGSGSAIYTARQFPEKFWNRAQFVAEPTGHLLGLFFLERSGADVIAHNARSLLASDDEWTSPIYAEVGPDGALWVVDWYNYIIQHNPTPRGFETGRGNAYDTPLRDKTHGRIYRLAWKEAPPAKPLNLSQPTPLQLVATFRNDNLLWRIHAQQQLVARGQFDVVTALINLTRDPKVDAIGLNPPAIHALWTLKGLGLLDGSHEPSVAAAIRSLNHASAAVRRAAVMVLPHDRTAQSALIEHGTLNDPDAQVRLASLLALSEMPPHGAAGAFVLSVLGQERNYQDRWITDAATAAAARNDTGFLTSALQNSKRAETANPNAAEAVHRVVNRVARHYAASAPSESIVTILTTLTKATPDATEALLGGLIAGWPDDQAPSLDSSQSQQLKQLMNDLPEASRDRLLALAQKWNLPDLFGASMADIIKTLADQVIQDTLADAQRSGAAARLIGIDDRPDTADLIMRQLSLLSTPQLANGMVNALSRSRNDETGNAIINHWSQLTPSARRTAILVLMRRPAWTLALLEAVRKETIARTDLGPEYWSQLRQHPDRNISRGADQLAVIESGVSSDRETIVTQLLPLATQKGDAKRGRAVYETTCAVCHVFNGQGGKVGPELTGIASRDRADVLLEILDPNRSVEANYRLWTVATKDGETFSGRLEAETQTTVEILDVAAQKHVIQRDNIGTLTQSPLSIMPVGFEALPAEDLTALLEYLMQTH